MDCEESFEGLEGKVFWPHVTIGVPGVQLFLEDGSEVAANVILDRVVRDKIDSWFALPLPKRRIVNEFGTRFDPIETCLGGHENGGMAIDRRKVGHQRIAWVNVLDRWNGR